MAGALGMILGLGGGSLMAAAGEKHRREQQLEDQARQAMNQMFINHLEQHPELATVDKFAQAAKKQFGSAWDTMLPQFQVMAAEKSRQLQATMAMLQAIPGGASYAAGLQPALAALGSSGASFPGITPGGSPSVAGPSAQPPASVSSGVVGQPSLDNLRAVRNAIASSQDLDPTLQKNWLSDLDSQIKEQQKATEPPTQYQKQELQQRDKEAQQREADRRQTEIDRQQDRALREQEIQGSQALRQETISLEASTRAQAAADRRQAEQDRLDMAKSSQALTKERDEDRRAQGIETLGKTLDTQRDKILSDFDKTPSPGIKARVDGYNSSAKMFYRRHAASGAPTLLKYSQSPGMTLGKYQVTSPKPQVEAVPPVYGVNRKTGQSGWRDADGVFYPDAGSN